jgi:hypothetical protein
MHTVTRSCQCLCAFFRAPLHAQSILERGLAWGTEEHCEGKKGFFIGYAVHKLLMCKLGRATEDDRDHFGRSDWIWRDRCLEDSFVFSSQTYQGREEAFAALSR